MGVGGNEGIEAEKIVGASGVGGVRGEEGGTAVCDPDGSVDEEGGGRGGGRGWNEVGVFMKTEVEEWLGDAVDGLWLGRGRGREGGWVSISVVETVVEGTGCNDG